MVSRLSGSGGARVVGAELDRLPFGAGATTVNAYLAEASIADRHGRGLFGEMPLSPPK